MMILSCGIALSIYDHGHSDGIVRRRIEAGESSEASPFFCPDNLNRPVCGMIRFLTDENGRAMTLPCPLVLAMVLMHDGASSHTTCLSGNPAPAYPSFCLPTGAMEVTKYHALHPIALAWESFFSFI